MAYDDANAAGEHNDGDDENPDDPMRSNLGNSDDTDGEFPPEGGPSDGATQNDEENNEETDDILDGDPAGLESKPLDAKDAQGDDAVMIEMADGSQVSLGELKSGGLRQDDYTRKTQFVADERRTVQAQAQSVQQAFQTVQAQHANLSNFLNSLLPDAPDPALATTNPTEYNRQIAIATQAKAELGELMQQGAEIDGADRQRQTQQMQLHTENEQRALYQTFPKLRDPEARKAFISQTYGTARSLGYSDEDFSATTDHRVFKMLHYASIGMKASQNRSTGRKAQRPAQGRHAGGRPAQKTSLNLANDSKGRKGNSKANRRFAQTGDIEDAMSVDIVGLS